MKRVDDQQPATPERRPWWDLEGQRMDRETANVARLAWDGRPQHRAGIVIPARLVRKYGSDQRLLLPILKLRMRTRGQ